MVGVKLTEKKIERIISLKMNKGLSERAIAKKVGCSRSTVNYQLHKLWY